MTQSNAALLPPNATPLEAALVATAARATDLPVPLRELWDVDNCPERLLPWLAWALAVKSWDSSWPEAVKRARIKQSIAVHRRAGSVGSVRRVVAAFGSSLAVREWWQTEPAGVPHSFVITLTVGGDLPQDAKFQDDILRAVDDVKPARSRYTLTAGTSAAGGIGVIGVARTITYARIVRDGVAPAASEAA